MGTGFVEVATKLRAVPVAVTAVKKVMSKVVVPEDKFLVPRTLSD